MTLDLACHVNGRRMSAPFAFEQRNPANLDEVVARLPEADGTVAAEAVEAANGALFALSADLEARSDALDRIGAALAARRETLAILIARETGKTIRDAEAEVSRASRIFRFFSGETLRIAGERFDSVRPGATVEVLYDPLGVIGAITPWNFPVAIPAWKIAPALAFGNAVIWKPSEHASGTAAALMDIIGDGGLPRGAVNMLLGAQGAGEAVLQAPGVAAITFTGSEATGRAVVNAAASRGMRVQAEMGGVNGLVVLADADLARAVDAVVNGAYFAAGQRCTATSRVIVDRAVAPEFTSLLLERMSALRIGDPLDRITEIGPLVSRKQKDAVLAALSEMAEAGQRPLREGRGDAAPACFVDPVLFAKLGADALIATEEVFGPIAGIIEVDGYDAALETLNSGRFGLCGGLFTASLKHAEHFKRNARVGMAMINLPTAGVDYHAPFGGMKASSYGPREQGRSARDFFTVTRVTYQAAGSS